MSRITDIFRWEYGLELRHLLLIAAVAVAGADLFIANLTRSVPPLLALAALCSPIIGVGAVLRASLDEQITIAAWSGVSWIGLGIVTLGLHSVLASDLPLSQFRQSHPLGLALMTIVSVGGVLFGVTVVVGVAKAVWQRRTGGDGGSTPEEQVLSEEEYADFEPLRDDTRPVVSPSSERVS